MSAKQLAIALYTGDVDRAIAVMEDMAATSNAWALAVQAGRKARSPLPPLPEVEPLILPQPGCLPGSSIGIPLHEGRYADEAVSRAHIKRWQTQYDRQDAPA